MACGVLFLQVLLLFFLISVFEYSVANVAAADLLPFDPEIPSGEAAGSLREKGLEDVLLRRACYKTADADLCFGRLSSALSRNDQTKASLSILNAALRGTIEEAARASGAISSLLAVGALSGSDSREAMAMKDCVELLQNTLEELRASLEEMSSGADDGSHRHANLQAWLSAALSNRETCLDGFDGTNEQLRQRVGAETKQLGQLLSNLLAVHRHLLMSGIATDSISDSSELAPAWVMGLDRHAVVRRASAVVAQDGSGHFRTVKEAVESAPSYNKGRYVIYVKRGEYRENMEVKRKKTNIVLVGDGMGATVITANRSFAGGWTTFRTATFAVSGHGFIARDITFRNTAGPLGRQAAALRVDSDKSAFFRCSIEGYQDTLYAHSHRQFYRDCHIYGTVDFIFGNALAVIQHSNLYTRPMLPGQVATITAQSRKDPNQNTGFSIHNCNVDAAFPTYLGRPWKPFSRAVFMQTYLGPQLLPMGWLQWESDVDGAGVNTVFYGEYMNYGPGAALWGRIRWPGYHVIMDSVSASFFTVRRFIGGLAWLPSTGVTFTADLVKLST